MECDSDSECDSESECERLGDRDSVCELDVDALCESDSVVVGD